MRHGFALIDSILMLTIPDCMVSAVLCAVCCIMVILIVPHLQNEH